MRVALAYLKMLVTGNVATLNAYPISIIGLNAVCISVHINRIRKSGETTRCPEAALGKPIILAYASDHENRWEKNNQSRAAGWGGDAKFSMTMSVG